MIGSLVSRRFLLLSLCILAWVPRALWAELTLEGRVLRGREPVAFARVVIKETRRAYNTEADGRFRFTVPEPGFYTFRVLDDEGLVEVRQELRFNGQALTFNLLAREGRPEVATDPAGDTTQTVGAGEGIVVRGRSDPTRVSRYRLEGENLKRTPGTFGDKLRVIGLLPGVTPAAAFGFFPTSNLAFIENPFDTPYSNSTRGFLSLRGSGSLASGFYLDGFRLPYPFHLGDQASVVANDYVRSIDVYMSRIPGRFAGVTGGVIDIEGPTDVTRSSGRINMGLFRSDAYFETPFGDGEGVGGPSGFAVVAARKSYPNATLLSLSPDALPPDAKFADYEDGQAKLAFLLAPAHRLELVLLGAGDRLQYFDEFASSGGGPGPGFDDRPPVGIDRNFYSGGLRYRYAGARVQHDLILESTGFRENFEVELTNPFTGELWFTYENNQRKFSDAVRNELRMALSDDVLLRAGGEYRYERWFLSIDDLLVNPGQGENTPDFTDFLETLLEDPVYRSLFFGDAINFFQTSAFVEAEIRAGRWTVTPGVRGQYYSLGRDGGAGPVLGVEYALTDTLALLGGGGRYFGPPPLIDMISRKSGNAGLELEESDLLAGGIEYLPAKFWTVKLEGFRNEFRNLVVADRFTVEPFALKQDPYVLASEIETVHLDPFENRRLRYSNDGTGDATGIELLVQRTPPDGALGWSGLLSYTYSVARRNNHQPRLTDDMLERLEDRNENRDVLQALELDGHDVLFYDNGDVEFWFDNDRRELYDLDRTHQANMTLGYQFTPAWRVGLRQLYATNRPFTPIIWSEAADFESDSDITFSFPVYSELYNSRRLPATARTDLRIDYFTNYAWGYANLYLDLINVSVRRQAEGENFTPLLPYIPGGVNPSVAEDNSFLQLDIEGQRVYLPLFLMGLEVKF